jgi:hypothetical protein
MGGGATWGEPPEPLPPFNPSVSLASGEYVTPGTGDMPSSHFAQTGATKADVLTAAQRGVSVSLYLREGYALAANKHGDRYLTGMRKQESKSRAMRMMRYGMSTEMTCAPIGWWDTASVFAYLHKHELPVHPVYACLQGGLLERDQLRVDMLSEERGSGMGRREWEQLYYRQELAVIASRTRARR